MFEQYNELLEEIEALQLDELPMYEANLRLVKQQLIELEQEIKNLEDECRDYNSPRIRSIIASEAQKIEVNYKDRLEALVSKRLKLTSDLEEKRQGMLTNVNADDSTESSLKKVFVILSENEEEFDGDFSDELRTPVETVPKLIARSKVFKNHLKSFRELHEPLALRIADTISLKDIFSNMTNPKVAVGLMTAYVIVLTLLAVNLSVITALLYSGLTAISVKTALSNASVKQSLLREYFLLKESYNSINELNKRLLSEKIDEINSSINEEVQNALDAIVKEEDELKDNYHKLLEDLERMKNDPEFIASNLSIVKNKMKALVYQKEEYKQEIESAQIDYDTCIEDLNEKKAQLSELRKAIEDKYLSNLTPGKSRVLKSSLFLGFEKNNALRLFEFNMKSTLLLYSGDVPAVTKLCLNILLEFFREMSPAALNVYIFDTAYGGQVFAPLCLKELSEIIHICSRQDECKDALNIIHHELILRNTIIGTMDINDYNQRMIDKNSLPLDYILVFAISGMESLLADMDLTKQLFLTGPKDGIIPIVCYPNDLFQELISTNGSKKKTYDPSKIFNLFSTIMENWYSYIYESDTLMKNDVSYIKQNLHRIKTLIER